MELFEFRLPDLGEGVVEGEITAWKVNPGDVVAEDDPLLEVMTDKATVVIPSPVAGNVIETRGRPGDIVAVGEVLLVISVEEAPASGEVETLQPEAKPVEAPPPAAVTPAIPTTKPVRAKASPAVRKLARELEVNLATLQGSGKGGRILKADVEAAAKGTPEAPHPTAAAAAAVPSATLTPAPSAGAAASRTATPVPGGGPAVAPGRTVTLPYRGLRRKIGQQMAAAKASAAHFTYVEEVDVTPLVELRAALNRRLADGQHIKLSYLPFILKACVEGFKRFPLLNATFILSNPEADPPVGDITVHGDYNIGVATATEEGLIVPVLKDVAAKSLVQLAAELADLADKAKTGRIALADLQEGTFTITSLGKLGGLLATPILNVPEVAILGVHKLEPRPVVRDGEIVIRQMMNLAISLDHRVVDGHIGAGFLAVVKEYLEQPERLGA